MVDENETPQEPEKETAAGEEEVTPDDWEAAMQEQAAQEAVSEGENGEGGVDEAALADEWAAALAEQEGGASAEESPYAAKPAKELFPDFGGPNQKVENLSDFQMIMDIPVQITVELGRTKMPIRNLLQLAHGSVIELDGLAGEPMDVLVNGTLIAQGEVVVVNEKFGIRLTDIITPAERMRKLRGG
ncbi:MAG TPA: flagellar motor switch protein FliN [Rhodocyclaceae bacterium]|jgi:flagellar motor switch protein FliN/FliY|nr:flagellar motor switch protein FliN [Rhodocyclaceae bacterium]